METIYTPKLCVHNYLMDVIVEIIKIVLPAAIVFATSYYLVKSFLQSEVEKRGTEKSIANQSLLTPLRLQAYERIVLFLERISPNSLVARVNRSGVSAAVLRQEFIKTINAEFEHNLSQQIYVSSKAWSLVKNAKEEITKLVNIAATQLPDNTQGVELSQKIIELSKQVQKMPTQVAIDYIKKEITREL